MKTMKGKRYKWLETRFLMSWVMKKYFFLRMESGLYRFLINCMALWIIIGGELFGYPLILWS